MSVTLTLLPLSPSLTLCPQTNIRILAQADPSVLPAIWHTPSASGGTIQTALDFAIAGGCPSNEADYASELFPSIGALASALGQGGDGKYAAFLSGAEPDYPHEAWFLWNQPLWDSGFTGKNQLKDEEESSEGGTDTKGGSVTTQDQGDKEIELESAAGRTILSRVLMSFGVTVSVLAAISWS